MRMYSNVFDTDGRIEPLYLLPHCTVILTVDQECKKKKQPTLISIYISKRLWQSQSNVTMEFKNTL